jgi:hypothetical protein
MGQCASDGNLALLKTLTLKGCIVTADVTA